MPNIPRFTKGRIISAQQLNEVVSSVNALNEINLPTQINEGNTFPAFDDSEETESASEYQANTWTEIARTTTTVRIENPEDAEQYVNVERVVTITF